jgi:hypothetical protein
MSSIIIAVHGLRNKPPQKLLSQWWKQSILHGFTNAGLGQRDFPLHLAYWADLLYDFPLNPQMTDPEDPYYLQYPFIRVSRSQSSHTKKLKKRFLQTLEKQFDRLLLNDDLSLNFSRITDSIITRYFSDLTAYYKEESLPEKNLTFKDLIRERLAGALLKHRRKDILLLSHSMGSIIAYDVLTLVIPDVNIHTWITFGSPLGLPVVFSHAAQEQKKMGMKGPPATPENVLHNWINFSDLDDAVAMNWNLVDDYHPNSRGVHPLDIIVENRYEWQGNPNPHKSFGYLQTPEIARYIHKFLQETRSPLIGWKDHLQIWVKGLFTK